MQELNYIALIHDINESLSSIQEVKNLLNFNDAFNKNDKERLVFEAVYGEFVNYGSCKEILDYLVFEYNVQTENSIDSLHGKVNKKVKKCLSSEN